MLVCTILLIKYNCYQSRASPYKKAPRLKTLTTITRLHLVLSSLPINLFSKFTKRLMRMTYFRTSTLLTLTNQNLRAQQPYEHWISTYESRRWSVSLQGKAMWRVATGYCTKKDGVFYVGARCGVCSSPLILFTTAYVLMSNQSH